MWAWRLKVRVLLSTLLFKAGLKPNLSSSKILKSKVILYIILTLRSKWADFFSLILSKNLTLEDISYYALFKKLTTFKTEAQFAKLKPRVFTDNFRTLKRIEPITSSVKQNFYSKMLTDFDNSVDKIEQFKLFKVFLKANSSLGFTNFIPHASFSFLAWWLPSGFSPPFFSLSSKAQTFSISMCVFPGILWVVWESGRSISKGFLYKLKMNN